MADLEFRINTNGIRQKRKKNTNNRWRKCCKRKNCTKGSQGKTDYCVKHGGGKICKTKDCTKSAIGKTDYCVKHGGGKICKN